MKHLKKKYVAFANDQFISYAKKLIPDLNYKINKTQSRFYLHFFIAWIRIICLQISVHILRISFIFSNVIPISYICLYFHIFPIISHTQLVCAMHLLVLVTSSIRAHRKLLSVKRWSLYQIKRPCLYFSQYIIHAQAYAHILHTQYCTLIATYR